MRVVSWPSYISCMASHARSRTSASFNVVLHASFRVGSSNFDAPLNYFYILTYIPLTTTMSSLCSQNELRYCPGIIKCEGSTLLLH